MINHSKNPRPDANGIWLKPKTHASNWLKYLGAGISIFINSMVMMALPANGTTSITLSWNPITDSGIAGYNLYYGAASGAYSNKLSMGNATSATIATLVEGNTYYFALTTYNSAGIESPMSSEASYKVPALTLGNPPVLGSPVYSKTLERLTIPVTGLSGSMCAVEASSDLVNWVRVKTNTVPFTFVQANTSQFVKRFFRAVRLP